MNYSRSRSGKDTNKRVQEYVASVPFDQRLYRQDIEGSIAHARIPAKQGIIAESEAKPKSRRWTSGEMKDGNGHKIRKNPL